MSTFKLSQLAETLIASEIVRLGATIKEKIRNGEEIFNFTIGDFDSSIFPIPQGLQDEIIKAYEQHHTNYPAAEGELALRKAVSGFIKEFEGIDYDSNEILIAAGGRPLIYSAYRTVVDKGDKVIYPVPSWNNNHYVHFTEGEHIIIESTRDNNFMPTASQIAPHLKGATLLALCSPLNPTGTTFSKEELEAICDLVLEENAQRLPGDKKLYLLYDQIYWTLVFGDTVHHNPVSLRPAMKAYTIFIDGISKAFAATGVRVGWAMGPAEVIAKMRSINSHIGSWAPMAEQVAVSRYLQKTGEIKEFLLNFKQEILFRLQGIHKGIIALKDQGYLVDSIAPQAAIYLTVQINLVGKKLGDGTTLQNQEEVTSFILDKAKLALVPFKAFGAGKGNSWYRISVGCCKKDDIEKMLANLKQAMDMLS